MSMTKLQLTKAQNDATKLKADLKKANDQADGAKKLE